LRKIREEKYFSNTNLLKKQIREDILVASKIIDKLN
jgi:FAD synthase